jgi:hypothetical protein
VVELYPESAYAHSDLAGAYKKLGKLDKAIEYQKIAVTKSLALIVWHQNKMKQILEEYEKEAGTN